MDKKNLTTVELAKYIVSQANKFKNDSSRHLKKTGSQKLNFEEINLSSFIPEYSKKILLFGMAAGSHVRKIKNSAAAEIWYIDQIKSINIPQNYCDHFYYGTVRDNLDNLPEKYFDCIILSDSLENNQDSDFLLRQLRDKLSYNGTIVCKFPNLRYFWNMYYLLTTKKLVFKFPGIGYSVNHMLYSADSMDQLFAECGFSCELTQGIHPYINWKWTLMNALLFNTMADTRYESYLKIFKLQA